MLIIGAGIAGLTAGCYARMNGYDTTIIEMHNMPGGLCTSWRRKDYLFDGSVAGLAGSAPGSPLFQLWKTIGVIDYCPLHYGDSFGKICLPDGKTITVFTNIDKLETHLLENFPSESKKIIEFAQAIRSVVDLDIPFSNAHGWEALKNHFNTISSSLSHLPALTKYGKTTIRQFASEINDQSLATVFHNFVHFGGIDVPLLTVILPLAYAHRKMAGIPVKGWLSFARAVEQRFIELGGYIRYKAKASKLLKDNNRVIGMELVGGEKIYDNCVLSTADGRFSRSTLVGKSAEEISHLFKPEDISDQPVQVNIGVNMDFSSETGSVTYVLKNNFQAAGREHSKITLHHKYYDPDAAPEGKSAVTIFLDSDYIWWQQLTTDSTRYRKEKEKCAAQVIEIIDSYIPGFKDNVEVIDVSTPITRERFTGNWMGAMQARKPNSNMIKALLQGKPKYKYPGIEGYYMAGQWVESWGGITTAALSGIKAIQAICKNDGKRFKS